jgi:hypothetical protein
MTSEIHAFKVSDRHVTHESNVVPVCVQREFQLRQMVSIAVELGDVTTY